jgi:hypothetical protein
MKALMKTKSAVTASFLGVIAAIGAVQAVGTVAENAPGRLHAQENSQPAASPLSQTKPPAPPDVHEYFNKLKARPEQVAEYSLRDQGQIEKYRTQRSRPSHVTYDPAKDADSRKQDAAKLVVPADKVSLHTTVRVPIPATKDDRLLVTWDAWFGREFAFNKTGIGTYKNFQFSSGRIWTEVRSRFKLAAPPAIAMVDVRQYAQERAFGEGTTNGPEVNGIKYGGAVIGPMVGDFAIMPETWTRYWVLFTPAGDWYEFSLWVADENRDAVQIVDRRLIKPNLPKHDYWDHFWLEYNTSSHRENGPADRGPLVAYARNIVMLKGVADPKGLFERPLGSGTGE